MRSKDWLYKRFEQKKIPNWTCPTCKTATLFLEDKFIVKPTTFFQKITNESYDEELGRDIPFDKDFISGIKFRFLGILKYTNKSCNEYVSIGGHIETTAYYDYDPEHGQSEELCDIYYPKFFDPPIHIINVSDKYPDEIKNQLKKAFSLFWIDNWACANSIRELIELTLDVLRIQKRIKNKKGKYEKLNLHNRILKLKNKDTEIFDFLMSIKWIGNSGSHLDKLNNKQILEGFELLDYVLNVIFIKDHERLKKLCMKINKAKKPC